MIKAQKVKNKADQLCEQNFTSAACDTCEISSYSQDQSALIFALLSLHMHFESHFNLSKFPSQF